MKQYLLSVHHSEGEPKPSEATMLEMFAAVDRFNSKVMEQKRWVFAGGLEPPETATVVRMKGEEVITTDGPFAESKEHIGGFWVIKAEDLDDALKWAAEASTACQNPVEVRPFQDEPES